MISGKQLWSCTRPVSKAHLATQNITSMLRYLPLVALDHQEVRDSGLAVGERRGGEELYHVTVALQPMGHITASPSQTVNYAAAMPWSNLL